MNKYDEVMEHVHVTDEMRDRVLAGVDRYFVREGRRKRRRTLYTAGIAAAVVLVVGLGSLRLFGPESIGIPGSSADETELAGASFVVTDCNSIQELESIVGFSVPVLTELPFDVRDTAYTAIGDDLAQISYYGEGDTGLMLRKSPGIGNNAGDYNSYENEAEVDINGTMVSFSGNGGLWYLACWNDEEYSYSLSSFTGCAEDTLKALVAEAMG